MQKQVLASVVAAMVLLSPRLAQPHVPRFRLRDLNAMHAAAVERALAGAARRLESAECRRIFADFRDRSGAPLQDRLDTLGLEAPDYLSFIVFANGAGSRSCHGTDIMAITAPLSRVVFVCGPSFAAAEARSPQRAEVVVLHEALHTLGLGENPPDSLEITRRVAERCAP
ncbi:MAG TPA: hypothetical protein VNH43_03895 [Vicinamibacteria bacterium]|nr:hypothetical protein [Vicinamibacteria bacterium]